MKNTYIKRHTPSEAVPRTRGWLLVILLAPVAALAGCSDDAPPLAQPTDRIPVPSRAPTPSTPAPEVDFDDPGLVFNGSWRVGDEWDYESNRSAIRQVRVTAKFTFNGSTHYLLTERTDRPAQIPDYRRHVVRGSDWMRLNTTDDRGFVQEFKPGIPLRQNSNSTYFYDLWLRSRDSPLVKAASVAGTTRYPSNATLKFPWGFVDTARIEHRLTAKPEGKDDLDRTLVIRYVAAEYLNDVYIVESDEIWRLRAAQVGDFRRGTLLPSD